VHVVPKEACLPQVLLSYKGDRDPSVGSSSCCSSSWDCSTVPGLIILLQTAFMLLSWLPKKESQVSNPWAINHCSAALFTLQLVRQTVNCAAAAAAMVD